MEVPREEVTATAAAGRWARGEGSGGEGGGGEGGGDGGSEGGASVSNSLANVEQEELAPPVAGA